jgi:hypothetical protein
MRERIKTGNRSEGSRTQSRLDEQRNPRAWIGCPVIWTRHSENTKQRRPQLDAWQITTIANFGKPPLEEISAGLIPASTSRVQSHL